jgi:hypothetical protein
MREAMKTMRGTVEAAFELSRVTTCGAVSRASDRSWMDRRHWLTERVWRAV